MPSLSEPSVLSLLKDPDGKLPFPN